MQVDMEFLAAATVVAGGFLTAQTTILALTWRAASKMARLLAHLEPLPGKIEHHDTVLAVVDHRVTVLETACNIHHGTKPGRVERIPDAPPLGGPA